MLRLLRHVVGWHVIGSGPGKVRALLTLESAKADKGLAYGIATAVLYMTPDRAPGDTANLCPWSSRGCRAGCLHTAGRGVQRAVAAARATRRRWFLWDPDGFMRQLLVEVGAHVRRCERRGLVAALRLNGTSDVDWSQFPAPGSDRPFLAVIRETWPALICYEYSKQPGRPGSVLSVHEHNHRAALRAVEAGQSIAVVFDTRRSAALPELWNGRPVVDGDRHDAVWLHAPGSVIGLRAKGRARRDTTGFVVRGCA